MENKLFISDKLNSVVTKQLKEVESLEIEVLKDTKDKWCRDYMPIPRGDGKYVTFDYRPDYLVTTGDNKYITDQQSMIQQVGIDPSLCVYLELAFDGGNYVKCGEHVLVFDKVFAENNKLSREEVWNRLKKAFNCDVIILPWHKPEGNLKVNMDKGEDVYGHTDGFFQPVDDNTILMTATQANMAPIMKPYFQAYRDILEKYYHIEQLTFNNYRCINDWTYINFVQLEDKILMPAIEGTQENDEAANQLRHLFHKEIIPIIMPTSLLNDGGALHCTTWNK